MKIIISNTVPVNGGDEALLEATVFGLERLFCKEDLQIKILTNDPILATKYIKSYDFDWDLECMNLSSIVEKLYHNLRRAIRALLTLSWPKFESIPDVGAFRRVKAHYVQADLILACPGGYIHDYYDYNQRLRTIDKAIKWGKKVIIFGQSIGPFWKPSKVMTVRRILERVHLIILREKFSFEHLTKIGLRTHHVFVHTDIAFLLLEKYQSKLMKKRKRDVPQIAVNFRAWEGTNETKSIAEKGFQLCKYLLDCTDMEILFLSTCQGVQGYYDDSLLAKTIYSKLDDDEKARCKVVDKRYAPFDLINVFAQCNCYIGMRLHGAILSMLSGTPALNIAYEDKTKGIYSALELDKYQLHYSSPIEKWFNYTDIFLSSRNRIKDKLARSLPNTSYLSWTAFQRLKTIDH